MKKYLTCMMLLILSVLCASEVQAFHRIPTVYLLTADSTAITSRDDWKEHTTLRIVMPDGTVVYESADVSVKGRGHSTFSKPKKPYAIKLESASGLLGMEASKRWVLLANFMDHSLVRNSLAFAISCQTSLAWTPDSRFVDVVLNGTPQGCYLLCEQVEADKHRVNVKSDGGYLLEVDSYFDETFRFRSRCRRLPFNVKYPKRPSSQQMTFIENYISDIEHLLYEEDTDDLSALYLDYLDMDSFVDWWLVHELTQNAEPNGPRSCYMHKGKDGLLKAGPVWDFDLAFITVGLDAGGDIRPSRLNRTDVKLLTGDSLYNRQSLWYGRLLEDAAFRARVQSRWQELKPRFRALADEIDRWKALIEPSALADEQLWKGQDPAKFDTHETFQSSIANLKQVYLYRLDSLDRLLSGLK